MPRRLLKPRCQSRLFSFRRRKGIYFDRRVKSIAHKALRPIAVIEASKGVIVVVAGFGLLSFLDRDNQLFAERIIRNLHLDPASHYPHIFIAAMARLDDAHLWALAGFAAVYAAVRFVEAYGLWNERRWAEWLAALSGAVYVPVEVYELFRRVTWIRLSALAINLAVVGYMIWLLTETRRRRAEMQKAAEVEGP